ncbi:MerR family DNA-binding transcriptional regulator [Streptomyces sp. HD1123-B1]|uniref:MerR family DNA-binding transcriptional regulator n=1 Tax=Streptomyces huangiella TaxID=3228804 RepID=UPI003D7D423F
MTSTSDLLTIGELATRSGLATSALRYYEELGLIHSRRTAGRQRRFARTWSHRIDQQIADLERLKRKLAGCIGCGCLSLRKCTLYNPTDTAAALGPGARYLLGDEPQSTDNSS